jgi:hypothetical protein
VRILIIYDVPGWAYERRANALKKYAPVGVDVAVTSYADAAMTGQWACDVVFLLDFSMAVWCRSRIDRMPKSERPLLVVSHNNAAQPDRWPGALADWTISNNHASWESLGMPQRSCCISNGVDTDVFKVHRPIEDRGDVVLWCGSASRAKSKGYTDILLPLSQELPRYGFECDFRLITRAARDPAWLNEAEQVAWYNSGSYVLCASESESTPNTTLEGMACGCVPVTTEVGNVVEFGKFFGPLGCTRDGKANCVIVDRSVESFVNGLLFARKSRDRLLSEAAVETMQEWSYGPPGNRADYFFTLFRRLVSDGPETIKPFSYLETEAAAI